MSNAVAEVQTREVLAKKLSIKKGLLTKATKAWEKASDAGDADKASQYGLKMDAIQEELDAIQVELAMLDEANEDIVKQVEEHKKETKTKAKTKAKKAKAKAKVEEPVVEEKVETVVEEPKVEAEVQPEPIVEEEEEVKQPKSKSSLYNIVETIVVKADEDNAKMKRKKEIEDIVKNNQPLNIDLNAELDVELLKEVLEDATGPARKPEVKEKKLNKDGTEIKGDWPQHSYRVERDRYPILKEHVKGMLGNGLEGFDSLADMSRSLNNADFFGEIWFWMSRSKAQYARFIQAAECEDKNDLSTIEQDMLLNVFHYYRANTDEEKQRLVHKFKKLLQVIRQINFNEFATQYEQGPYTKRITNVKTHRA